MAMIVNKESALTHIYLDHNMIEDEGAEHFSTAIKNNRSILYLYLNHNKITINGARKLASSI